MRRDRQGRNGRTVLIVANGRPSRNGSRVPSGARDRPNRSGSRGPRRRSRPAKPKWQPSADRGPRAPKSEWQSRSEPGSRPPKPKWQPRAEEGGRPAKPKWQPSADRGPRAPKSEWQSRSEPGSRPPKPKWQPRADGGRARPSRIGSRAPTAARARPNQSGSRGPSQARGRRGPSGAIVLAKVSRETNSGTTGKRPEATSRVRGDSAAASAGRLPTGTLAAVVVRSRGDGATSPGKQRLHLAKAPATKPRVRMRPGKGSPQGRPPKGRDDWPREGDCRDSRPAPHQRDEGRRSFDRSGFERRQSEGEPSSPPRPRGPNREPRPSENPEPSPPPRPSEPEVAPPGPPERGGRKRSPRS